MSLQDIQDLLRSPQDYSSDVASIKTLLAALDQFDVTVVIAEPNRLGASGEWNPRRGEMRISHSVVARGTQAFRRVLNHEAIHTAQSCAGGSIRSFPKPLGLSRRIDRQALRHLDGKVYVGLSSIGRRLGRGVRQSRRSRNRGFAAEGALPEVSRRESDVLVAGLHPELTVSQNPLRKEHI
ncbi:MAG: hypothetical protein CM15mP39_03200 [Synechococcus sp.]|nr:MAG: hypothetical protein CM15mP39_03200 [Synechococcus sp.]